MFLGTNKAITHFMMFLLIALCDKSGFAWGTLGHKTICNIAWSQLSHHHQKLIEEVTFGKQLSTICNWPDEVRTTEKWGFTYDWHFININDPRDYWHPGKHWLREDILRGLLKADEDLRIAGSSQDLFVSLAFISHLIGDLHQPLHVGREKDLGGNTLKVKLDPSFFERFYNVPDIPNRNYLDKDFEYYCMENKLLPPLRVFSIEDAKLCGNITRTLGIINLHKAWDKYFLLHFFYTLPNIHSSDALPALSEDDMSQVLTQYLLSLPIIREKRTVDQWQREIYSDFINDSMNKREVIYNLGEPNIDPSSGKRIFFLLGEEYYSENINSLLSQILKAGYRLAFTLTRLLSFYDYNKHKENLLTNLLHDQPLNPSQIYDLQETRLIVLKETVSHLVSQSRLDSDK